MDLKLQRQGRRKWPAGRGSRPCCAEHGDAAAEAARASAPPHDSLGLPNTCLFCSFRLPFTLLRVSLKNYFYNSKNP